MPKSDFQVVGLKFAPPSKSYNSGPWSDLGVAQGNPVSQVYAPKSIDSSRATSWFNSETKRIADRGADAVGGVAGILGAASLAAPALIPVAAATGVGYGIYKLGESLKLW